MTQTIRAAGPHVDEYKDMFRKMAENAPNGMARLAVELDQLASGT